MKNKFTEEQYQKIIRTYESSSEYVNAIRLVLNYIDELTWLGYEEALAVANPLTREWAHDKFVEKEKKYYWKNKKTNKQANPMRLFHGSGGIVQMMGPKEGLTESEIKAWGYNPEMFDKEEV